MNIEPLPMEFVGTGEVQDYRFVQVAANLHAYIYAVTRNECPNPQYEVIKRTTTPKCIDFAARLFSTTEFKETYPKAAQFGKTAWAFVEESKAIEKFNQLGAIC